MKKGIEGITVGEILLEDYLKPMKISQYRLAKELKIPLTRISAIVRGKRIVTVDTALRLGRFFKTSPEFWLNLQQACDLRNIRETERKKIEREVHPFRLVAQAA